MILERRAYSLRPGAAGAFWELQEAYNDTAAMRRLLSHTVSYFETWAGAAYQIVHLHRFDSMQEWEETYAVLYRDHPKDYFVQARSLLVAQQNMFFRPSPLGTDLLLEGQRPVVRLGNETLIAEERVELMPGAADPYWSAVRQRSSPRPGDGGGELLGSYLSFIGPLPHRPYLSEL